MTRQFNKPAAAPQKLIAQIHIAKAQLGLGEADYRALLTQATGKSSSKDMTPAELGRVIEAMVKLGFKVRSKGAPRAPDTKSGSRFSGTEGAQNAVKKSARANIRLIFGLWSELGSKGLIDNASRPALFKFVERMSGVGHPDWLDNAQANKIVEALKAIRHRGLRNEGWGG